MNLTPARPAISPKKPIALADFGSFFVGGRTVRIEGKEPRAIAFTKTASFNYDPNGTYHVEQAYVQYFIPVQQRHALPIVMLHGGGITGAMWEQTPDGRQGWVQDFLRLGHAVYVVDNVERGRAGWTPFEEVWADAPIIRNAEESWTLFRIGAAQGWADRRAFPGQRFPVAAFDTLVRHAVPRWLGNNDAALRGFCAVLDRIGPCLVLMHSHGGEVAFRAAQERPDLVQAMVAIEPSGFSPEVASGSMTDKQVLFVYGDFLDATPLWRDLVKAGESYAGRLSNDRAQVTFWRLAEMGIPGNSHFPMMDSNSTEVALRISEWIDGKNLSLDPLR
jgi:pimeloyl-ACP methyl ester carboxylesterase